MLKSRFLVLLCLLAGVRVLAATDTNNEQQCIAILKSNASLTDKDAACARLKHIGTPRCVPALAALLDDQQLSHSARYALESMDFASAGRALVDALTTTSGLTKVGIIDSLAARGEIPAAPALTRELADTNVVVAAAAAHALGQIGAQAGLNALLTGITNSTGPLHAAEADALLCWAKRLLSNGHEPQARELFEQLYYQEKNEGVRVAAYRGLIAASPEQRVELVVRAIPGPPGPIQVAAMQSVHDLQGRDATDALAALLPQLEPALQIPVIDGLAQRGDPGATPVINSLAASPVPAVRLAALHALDTLGDPSSVGLLSEFATSGTPDEQRAARQALQDLNRGNITDALLTQLGSVGPAVQAELATTLGSRGDRSAVPELFALIAQGPDRVRSAAFQSLGQLADNSDLGPMAQYILDTKSDAARIEAALAFRAACRHIQAHTGNLDLEPLVRGLRGGSPAARIALLPTCSDLVSPQVRLGLRAGVQDANPQVRDAALHALCDTIDPDLLDDIVSEARSEPRDNYRVLAIKGGIRLATAEDSVKISNGQRIAVLNGLLASAKRPEEKRLVVSGLAEVPDLDSLLVVQRLLDDPDVKAEASQAALRIAVALPSGEAHETLAVLDKALAASTNPSTQQALQAAMQQIQARADFLTDWQVAGPYRQPGKNYSALFDILFPPELDNAKDVTWQPLPAGDDPKRPWVMDLLKPLNGGEQCVAYARTWVHCDKDVTARLELGSDDGIKVWLNDKQVFAHNVTRTLKPGSDQVDVNLHSGWNRLLLKVTQNKQAWEFCARVLKADGTPVEGLRCAAAPST